MSQTLNNKTGQPPRQSAKVPSGRMQRMSHIGSLATRVAGGMIAEGARRLVKGERPSLDQMLLTPANLKRVADQLAKLRGAAMKVGQLLSMDAGDLLPPELSELLSGLRDNAVTMPMSQLNQVLVSQLGDDWSRQFQQFSFTPMAAASIGQVHQATSASGEDLAIKIQYPGIRESIDSDVDNVASLIRLSGLLPKELDISDLLTQAKQQLHAEADYQQEAKQLLRFRELLKGEDRFLIPNVHPDISTQSVLAMDKVSGVPIEQLVNQPKATRDQAVSDLIELMFKEMFEFKLVQTDPNFANFLYQTDTQQLVLLDFGATRDYDHQIADGYLKLFHGAMNHDRASMAAAAEQIGFFSASIKTSQKEAVLDIFELACGPISQTGEFNFGDTQLFSQLRDAGTDLSMQQDYWHTPPADALFFHRKLGGLYLLAAKLNASVDVRRLIEPFVKQ